MRRDNRNPLFVAFASVILMYGSVSAVARTTSAQQTPTPTARARVVRTPGATATPPPIQTPIVLAGQGETLEQLQSKIRQQMFAPDIRRGRIGIKLVSLNSGKVVFENDSEKYFMPASNMKNFTVATAIERLGPAFRFVTDVNTTTPPDADGTVKGDLSIYGRGDISFSTSFDPAFPSVIDHFKAIDILAAKIVAAGIKRIDGNLIADESYFRGFALPETWEWDDLQTYSGAEVSAFPINDNVIDISIKPASIGGPCILGTRPMTSLVTFVNKCVTVSGGTASLRTVKAINQNTVEVAGTVPVGSKELFDSVTFTHTAELFIDLLRQRLTAKGVVVAGRTVVTNSTTPAECPTCSSLSPIKLSSVESPPLSYIAAKTMKPSQNMYTETLLWTLGEQIGRKAGGTGDSSRLGLGVVKDFLKEIGIPDDGIVQYDGSGLSRHDLITPSAVVALYTFMAKQSKNAQVWRDSLTIGGVDGTLANRFKGTAAAGNIRGKTGTIDQVSALSGYLTTAAGEEVVLSIVVNGVPGGARTRTKIMDDIVIAVANFNGKID